MLKLQIVVVSMRDYIFADAITQALTADNHSEFAVERVYTPNEMMQYANLASILLMETTEYNPMYTLKERMKIRDKFKECNPNCKIILVVDENTEKDLAKEVVNAKKNGLIDNFIFGTVSASYLKAVISST